MPCFWRADYRGGGVLTLDPSVTLLSTRMVCKQAGHYLACKAVRVRVCVSCGAHAPPDAAGAAAERAARSAADAGWSELEAESGSLGQSSSLGDSGAG